MNEQQDSRTGTFWRMPYNWQKPTLERFKRTLWNPEGNAILVPKVFGWGYDMNLHALLRRIGLIRQR